MGASISTFKTQTVDADGHETFTASVGGPNYTRRTITRKTPLGSTVTAVTCKEDHWEGTETFRPLHVGPATVTNVYAPTLQRVALSAESNDEMIAAIKAAPMWMDQDMCDAAKAYYNRPGKTVRARDISELKSSLKPADYHAVCSSLLEAQVSAEPHA